MQIVSEFKEFAVKGNATDLAVGIVIGGAFGKIVNSFVNDVIMPVAGLLTGRVDFPNLFVDFSGEGYTTLAEARAAGAPVLAYGQFINTIVEFLIVAVVLFLIVKILNRLRRQEKKEAQEAKEEEKKEHKK